MCTNLLWIPQVKEVQVALVTHLLVCGEHDDVAAEIEAARPDSRVGLEQGQLFTWTATHNSKDVTNADILEPQQPLTIADSVVRLTSLTIPKPTAVVCRPCQDIFRVPWEEMC